MPWVEDAEECYLEGGEYDGVHMLIRSCVQRYLTPTTRNSTWKHTSRMWSSGILERKDISTCNVTRGGRAGNKQRAEALELRMGGEVMVRKGE